MYDYSNTVMNEVRVWQIAKYFINDVESVDGVRWLVISWAVSICYYYKKYIFIADYDSNLLFWVDAKLHVIFTSDFEGQNRQVVLTSYSNLVHPFSVAVFEVCSSGCL